MNWAAALWVALSNSSKKLAWSRYQGDTFNGGSVRRMQSAWRTQLLTCSKPDSQTLIWSKSLREEDEKQRWERKRGKKTLTPGGTQTRNLANGLPYSNQLSYQVTWQLSGWVWVESELIFVNGMVHLPHEWNFGRPTTLPSPATPLSPLTVTPEAIFSRTWCHTFNITTYEIIATCIERATVLRARVMRKYKCALLFMIDKLMSGSSLEGKAILRSHMQNSEL